jgi:hypothetical protein
MSWNRRRVSDFTLSLSLSLSLSLALSLSRSLALALALALALSLSSAAAAQVISSVVRYAPITVLPDQISLTLTHSHTLSLALALSRSLWAKVVNAILELGEHSRHFQTLLVRVHNFTAKHQPHSLPNHASNQDIKQHPEPAAPRGDAGALSDTDTAARMLGAHPASHSPQHMHTTRYAATGSTTSGRWTQGPGATGQGSPR